MSPKLCRHHLSLQHQNIERWLLEESPHVVMDTDTESQNVLSTQDRKGTQRFVRAGKVPLPLRRSHLLADALGILLCLTAAA